MLKVRPLLCLPLLLLGSGCSVPQTGMKEADWKRMKVTTAPPRQKIEYGKGLNGRIENGVKIYTVTVGLVISKEGKVSHAEVVRSDAPKRLQWAAVRSQRLRSFKSAPKTWVARQTIVFRGIEAEPD